MADLTYIVGRGQTMFVTRFDPERDTIRFVSESGDPLPDEDRDYMVGRVIKHVKIMPHGIRMPVPDGGVITLVGVSKEQLSARLFQVDSLPHVPPPPGASKVAHAAPPPAKPIGAKPALKRRRPA